MIVKIKGGWVIKDKEGKNISRTYKTKKQAEKRLRQIEYFSKK